MPGLCAACSKKDASSICGRCKCTYYCDVKCQRLHWKQHKKTCNPSNTIINHNDNFKLLTEKCMASNYVDRIDMLLKKYKMFINSNVKNQCMDIFKLISSHYDNDKVGCFLDDYAQYVENIENNELYRKYSNKCEIKKCKYIG
eukprot:542615_1